MEKEFILVSIIHRNITLNCPVISLLFLLASPYRQKRLKVSRRHKLFTETAFGWQPKISSW